jgi:hypothetical protein
VDLAAMADGVAALARDPHEVIATAGRGASD